METPDKTFWIDCPSSFDQRLEPAGLLLFTHHHFLGASNQYRELFGAQVWIHKLDSVHEICRAFTFDVAFEQNFAPGFTMYFFEDCLFLCDYVFLEKEYMRYNPFGPAGDTVAGGNRIREILTGKDFSWVCGVNYVVPFSGWMEKFKQMPLYGGY